MEKKNTHTHARVLSRNLAADCRKSGIKGGSDGVHLWCCLDHRMLRFERQHLHLRVSEPKTQEEMEIKRERASEWACVSKQESIQQSIISDIHHKTISLSRPRYLHLIYSTRMWMNVILSSHRSPSLSRDSTLHDGAIISILLRSVRSCRGWSGEVKRPLRATVKSIRLKSRALSALG